MKFSKLVIDVLADSNLHVYVLGWLLAFAWRLLNIRNRQMNKIANQNNPMYDDTNEDVNALEDMGDIDWLLVFVECSVGALFSILAFNFLEMLLGIHDNSLRQGYLVFAVAMTAIPGYAFFVRSREFINQYVLNKLKHPF